jgi:hypothetical protein
VRLLGALSSDMAAQPARNVALVGTVPAGSLSTTPL